MSNSIYMQTATAYCGWGNILGPILVNKIKETFAGEPYLDHCATDDEILQKTSTSFVQNLILKELYLKLEILEQSVKAIENNIY